MQVASESTRLLSNRTKTQTESVQGLNYASVAEPTQEISEVESRHS